MKRRATLGVLCAIPLFAGGCVPDTTYSAAVRDPHAVALDSDDRPVLAPSDHGDSQVIRQEEMPLAERRTIALATRSTSGAIDVAIEGCPRREYDRRLELVDASGALLDTRFMPTTSGPVLVWPHGDGPYGTSPSIPLFCRYTGTLETPMTNVQWVKKTTSGRTGVGVLGIVVGSLMAGGGSALVGIGADEKSGVPIAIGSPLVAVGLLALAFGLYQVTLPTRTETLFPPTDGATTASARW